MKVSKFAVGKLQTNCYLLESFGESVIIDPGDDGDFLSEKIYFQNLNLKMLLVTHGHFDHVLAANELKINFKAPLFISKKDLFLLEKAGESAFFWTGIVPKFKVVKPSGFLKAYDKIEFGRDLLEVIETPGHTPGSLSYYNEKEKMLFCGDLIFKNGLGRTDFVYSLKRELNKALNKILKLPPETIVFPGHGDKFRLEKAKLFV